MRDLRHYILLADLFRYPDGRYVRRVNACQALLDEKYPEAGARMEVFSKFIHACDEDGREELYTKTFDVQPICYLDLGYVIFGEDYKRGAFLLHMQSEQHAHENECGTDLPDNISNVFTLIAKHPEQGFVEELAVKIIIPAVKKMIAEFDSARVELKLKVLRKLHKAIIQEDLNQGNVYRNCFEAILKVLEQDFQGVTLESPEKTIQDEQRHQSFFSKESINKLVNIKTTPL
jgi:nitrate reductase assembly molybdenum cofactor insertion protein NarJ